MSNNFFDDINFIEILNSCKSMLSDYETISIKSSDLKNTDKFNMDLYSDELGLFRSHEDSLVYLHDSVDGTVAPVELEDLKIILNNYSFRTVEQKRQADELEKFLSEWLKRYLNEY